MPCRVIRMATRRPQNRRCSPGKVGVSDMATRSSTSFRGDSSSNLVLLDSETKLLKQLVGGTALLGKVHAVVKPTLQWLEREPMLETSIKVNADLQDMYVGLVTAAQPSTPCGTS